jgi:hypothetical protein
MRNWQAAVMRFKVPPDIQVLVEKEFPAGERRVISYHQNE